MNKIDWIINKDVLKSEKREQDKNTWEVKILFSGEYLIKQPYQMRRINVNTNKEEGRSSTWANIKAKIVYYIQASCPNSHTFMRIKTYDDYRKILEPNQTCHFEVSSEEDKGSTTLVISDCPDRRIWEAFFAAGSPDNEDKILFTLNYQPENWREIVKSYFQIVRNTWALRNSISDFVSELEGCCVFRSKSAAVSEQTGHPIGVNRPPCRTKSATPKG